MNRQKEAQATKTVKLVPYRDISAPPSLEAKPPAPPQFSFKAPEFKAPPSGIPVPVPKEEAPVTTIASQEQNPFASAEGDTGLGSDLSAGVPWGVEGGGDVVIEEELPSPEDFVPVEQQPELVEKPPPVYPELAQMSKIEGTVIVRVLVGKDGKVKDAILGKGVNDMLDQAAIDAAKNYVFKPAMQNKKPVAVWVAIPFKFSLY
jgi:protein TonB